MLAVVAPFLPIDWEVSVGTQLLTVKPFLLKNVQGSLVVPPAKAPGTVLSPDRVKVKVW